MGPLNGLKVIEIAGLGPTPYCGMLLADLGADVVRVDRLQSSGLGVEFPDKFDLRSRNKRSVALDMKAPEGRAVLTGMLARADILIEGFRPGVMERLGFGPEDCWSHNPRLIYGRATGWGQSGPMAHMAGHDINYIAMTGALDRIGPSDRPPVPPLNLLGDYAGGGLTLAFGLICAVHETRTSGRGQVVDTAMIDGVTSLMTVFHAFHQLGDLRPERGQNLLDGGAPFYCCYAAKDGKYVAVGAIEDKFYRLMLEKLGLDPSELPDRGNRDTWPELKRRFEQVFRTRTRDEWSEIFDGSDACVTPVLAMDEVATHPHSAARDLLVEVDGVRQPSPSPRFSRTPGGLEKRPPARGEHGREALADWGVNDDVVEAALRAGGLADGDAPE